MPTSPLILITGFGPFPGCAINPSAALVKKLVAAPPPGVRVVGHELPVTFLGAPAAVDKAVADLGGERPALLLGLGVQREASFRIETQARGTFNSERPDADGLLSADLALDLGPPRFTSLAVRIALKALRTVTEHQTRISDDAGGYVCDRIYRALLEAGERINVPALFLHVPPIDAVPVEEQFAVVSAWMARYEDWIS